MKKYTFEAFIKANTQVVEEIRNTAWKLHESVGQTYDENLPYGHHLSMVADAAMKYGHEVIENESDIIPVIFAAYFHDSIEDARLTYNNVISIARRFMTGEQAHTAAEIVYALTNDKGRTRTERAGEHYYAGIRETPYAPFIKLCDRLANMTHCFNGTNDSNRYMHKVYESEWPHFLQAITVGNSDNRFALSQSMLEEVEIIANN
ncbi:MAG: hypothetical protein MJZ20_02255 [Bacteroidaceae bacterium]|nr:hypothetical protein [Bacteroidaceae bacterium]